VTCVEVVIGNSLPVSLTPLCKYSASKITGSQPWPSWPFDSRRSTF